jgi:hypothetical protein
MSSFGELYFGRIPDRAQAAAAARAAARGFYLVALLYVVDPLRLVAALETTGPIVPLSQVFDAALLVFLASSMAHWQSRAFAILLVPWTFFFTLGVLVLRAEHMQFGSNVFMPALGLYLAFRGVLATTRYHRYAQTRLQGGVAAIKAVAGCVGALAVLVGLHLGLPLVAEVSAANRISLMMLGGALGFAMPYAPWFPVLGRMRLTLPASAARSG